MSKLFTLWTRIGQKWDENGNIEVLHFISLHFNSLETSYQGLAIKELNKKSLKKSGNRYKC